MNLSAWFIRRPIATSLLMLGILFLGVASYTQLPISGAPQVDIPTIAVTTALPGASAGTGAAGIPGAVEGALANLPRGISPTSSSTPGSSSIDVQFDLSRSV